MSRRHPERFLATLLFTDIVRSTEVAAELGDRGWRDLVQEHHRLIRAALRRHGGRELDTAGDGFFAIFDAPAAAAASALEAIDAVTALGIEIRAGIHVGEVEEIGPKVGGIAVSTAARIMAAAGASQLVASSTVRDLAAGAGLQFTDIGERELKGVPGAWRLYAVTRADAAPASATERDPKQSLAESETASRRAAAVRRSRSRPIWQRRPRLTAAISAALVVAVVFAALLVWSPWRPKALAGVSEHAVGIIDPERNEIVAETQVGDQPAAIAVGEGSVWVANGGANTISRIDPATRAVTDTIEVGSAPKGIAIGAGSVWVANSGARSVSRINVATGRTVATIQVGNGPTGIAFGADAVWVANSQDATVTRIDPASNHRTATIGVGSPPWAVAVDANGVWVASQEGGTVSHLDPASGAAVSAAIPVGSRPSALAVDAGAVWVANTGDGSISRIDARRDRVVGVTDVGGSPDAIAVAPDAIWVADASGAVLRIAPDQPNAPPIRVATGSAAEAVAVVDGQLWFASGASAASHRGGELRVVSQDLPSPDTNAFGPPELQAVIDDELVAYRHIGGIAGSQLVADLAAAIPVPTDGGLTYTFVLRPGIVYSDGTPVLPSHFVYAMQRIFQVADPTFGNLGGGFYANIMGAAPCLRGDGKPVARCDLSKGIVADDVARTVTFHLSAPDPDFLFELALPFATPLVPGSVPDHELASQPYPTLGPYAIASVSATEIHLVRNPKFKSPEPELRPAGFVDEVTWTGGVDPARQVEMVEQGTADYVAQQIPADAFDQLRTQFTPQLHLATAGVTAIFMNTRLHPFDDPDVRRAVNLAIDRNAIAALRGGSLAAVPTCQVLPPNFPGYEPYCPYTVDPGPSGRGPWVGPNLPEARRLIAHSGKAKTPVVVGPFAPRLTPLADYMRDLLAQIGFKNVEEVTAVDSGEVFGPLQEGRIQMGAFEFSADFPGPDTFLGGFTCDEADGLTNYCDKAFDEAVSRARALQTTDAPAAAKAWAEVDRMATDLALYAPLVNEGSDFVSARVGNYQASVPYGILFDQIWVQ